MYEVTCTTPCFVLINLVTLTIPFPFFLKPREQFFQRNARLLAQPLDFSSQLWNGGRFRHKYDETV